MNIKKEGRRGIRGESTSLSEVMEVYTEDGKIEDKEYKENSRVA